jgi:MYXO-CTERM domain-containing protein
MPGRNRASVRITKAVHEIADNRRRERVCPLRHTRPVDGGGPRLRQPRRVAPTFSVRVFADASVDACARLYVMDAAGNETQLGEDVCEIEPAPEDTTGGSPDDSGPGQHEDSGCGCTGGGSPGFAWLAALGLLALVRRRRP